MHTNLKATMRRFLIDLSIAAVFAAVILVLVLWELDALWQ